MACFGFWDFLKESAQQLLFFQATTLGINLKLSKGGQIYCYMHPIAYNL